jgi:hypothetical protein
MPTLSFEGETQGELVAKVKRWLASVEGEDRPLSPAEAIKQSAEITKDALRVIASSAPGPVRESEIVKGLTAMGYQVTDASSKLLVDALDALSNVTGGGLLRSAGDAGAKAMFEMNQAVAKQLLKSLRGARK